MQLQQLWQQLQQQLTQARVRHPLLLGLLLQSAVIGVFMWLRLGGSPELKIGHIADSPSLAQAFRQTFEAVTSHPLTLAVICSLAIWGTFFILALVHRTGHHVGKLCLFVPISVLFALTLVLALILLLLTISLLVPLLGALFMAIVLVFTG